MAPKFRGDEEDWLDDEENGAQSSHAAPKNKRSARDSHVAEYLEPHQTNGTVVEVFPKLCRVQLDSVRTFDPVLCSYRRAAILGAKAKDESRLGRDRAPVAVGDRVHVERTSPQAGVVDGMAKRRNELIRPAPGREGGALFQVLAANVDLVVVVASATQPEFSEGLVDRFLVTAEASQISALLVVTKTDLPFEDRPWRIYEQIGYLVVEVSNPRHEGIDQLAEHLRGKTSVFCGHSGVGKTSLLNSLLGDAVHRVGEVAETGKGRHTTTSAVMIPFEWDPESDLPSRIIDTPGIKELGLVGMHAAQVAAAFPEFRGLECNTARCLHRDEEGCLARDLPRYPSYRRIVESLETT